MSKIDYQALRDKAEKATCGVWSLEYGEERFDAGDALIHREVVGYLPICRIEGAHPESGFDEDFQMEQQANAEFIAAASPATVLALLDELENAERQILKLERLAEAESVGADKAAESCVEWMKRCHAAEKRIAELELREVVLPQCYSMLHRVDFDEPYHTEMVYRQHQVLEALHNAGINVTEAGKGEAS
ncbi:TPA: ead/Ea22-like family protein [Escherichia coli]|nr:ead/Ea22-like family protein [Escherichia coli]HDV3791820.1 ead/Ea22-like family protein [Escherichia coli]HDV3811215.1 ead/Ea22-like family protein [Escherichia coli]HDV3853919.1 ead/Ea22-like family protein [Escherichia coli]